MNRHSIGTTIKYEFDCQKKTHLKIAKENNGTDDIRIVGERNGLCPKVILGFAMDVVNRGLQRRLTIDDLKEFCRNNACQHAMPGSSSCLDKMIRDYAKDYEELNAENKG